MRTFDDLADESVEGCFFDGISAREHGQRHAASMGWHAYVPPTPVMLQDRMRARRDRRAQQRYQDAINSGLTPYEAAADAWGRKE